MHHPAQQRLVADHLFGLVLIRAQTGSSSASFARVSTMFMLLPLCHYSRET